MVAVSIDDLPHPALASVDLGDAQLGRDETAVGLRCGATLKAAGVGKIATHAANDQLELVVGTSDTAF